MLSRLPEAAEPVLALFPTRTLRLLAFAVVCAAIAAGVGISLAAVWGHMKGGYFGRSMLSLFVLFSAATSLLALPKLLNGFADEIGGN